MSFRAELEQSKCYLHFKGGEIFSGFINRNLSQGIWGEPAFTTAMSGYQETITDPSYLGQHIIFAYPHIGNYPSEERFLQHHRASCVSVIAREFSPNDFLQNLDIPLISGVDTRALVKFIASGEAGSKMLVSGSDTPVLPEEFTHAPLICNELERVSQSEPKWINKGTNPIVLVNYGVKQAIVDQVAELGMPLITVPFTSSLEDILSYDPRMVFLSNGPGDPQKYVNQIEVVRGLLQTRLPIRAICLGHQLTCLALGAKSYRLPFGHRGINHPVFDYVTDKVVITSQNHGYALDLDSIRKFGKDNLTGSEIFISNTSLFDGSLEGISSTCGRIKTVQHHPEANPGPQDAAPFFKEIKTYLEKNEPEQVRTQDLHTEPVLGEQIKKDVPYRKILVIGSGPIKIGQASEFDYSGTQACRSLKAQGIDVVLLNSNPATIMTDKELTFRTYIEPITKQTLRKIIEKEKPDALLSTLGGQTALNASLELEEAGYLKQHNVALLGANAKTIEKTEDRELFSAELDEMGYKTGKRLQAYSREEMINLAETEIGFPLLIRRNFALGGQGAALIESREQLEATVDSDFKFPIAIERSLFGFKEVELEVMVDKDQNGVIICSIENIDPCGVHTGDSITVAPVQTISDRCYQKLRTMALETARRMGVVAGGANVQFAINPNDEDDIVVIEMNPRVSRSSALASKATGYPIAKISALLAVGYTLKEILNDITKVSPVSFEPTLDYVAIKIPRFPFEKFPSSSKKLGPQMRSVGEVLSIGSNFNEAFLKGLRSLECGLEMPYLNRALTIDDAHKTDEGLRERLKNGEELSLVAVMEGLRRGFSKKEVEDLTKISPWFIDQVGDIIDREKELKENSDSLLNEPEQIRKYKAMGFSDEHLAYLCGIETQLVTKARLENKIVPIYKAVDTCSGEFLAKTPYFYGTYQIHCEATPFQKLEPSKKAYVVLGSGPNRIGQGIEFDYSCVKACQALRKEGHRAIMVNSNPETVSTDYDSSDRLYLAPLHWEDLLDIFTHEDPAGVIASFSGQTGIKIRSYLEKTFLKELHHIKFLGPSMNTLDLCEDRKQFDEVLHRTPISKTKSLEVSGYSKLLNAINEIGFPVIIRPSYVIGGESMYIFRSFNDLDNLPSNLHENLKQTDATFLVENYLENAIEFDVDLIRDKKGNIIYTVCEHIEHAGVHSGDSGMITPPVQVDKSKQLELRDISEQLANELDIIGPVNFQFAITNGKIYCIEANPRGSRTLPFLSKAFDVSLPEYATKALLDQEIPTINHIDLDFFCVKQSTFPFDRFLDDCQILGPKMRSTGETMGIDSDSDRATMKSYLANYPGIRNSGKILFSLSNASKPILLPYLEKLKQAGMAFYATPGTARYIKEQGFECTDVGKIGDSGVIITDILKDKDMNIVCNTPINQGKSKSDGAIIRTKATANGLACYTRVENIESILSSLVKVQVEELEPISLQELHK